MTTVSIQVDTRAALQSLGLAQAQYPFALKQAINATALQAQRAQLALMRQRFIERRPQFAEQSVKLEQFATKALPVARLAITGPVSAPTRGDIYARFEDPGTKVPSDGGHYLAVPVVGTFVKPSTRSIVRTDLRPNALRDNPTVRTFVRRFTTQTGRATLGIFGVRRLDEAIAERNARGGRRTTAAQAKRASPTLLYALLPSAPVDGTGTHHLDFVATVRATYASGWEPNWRAAVAQALATAR